MVELVSSHGVGVDGPVEDDRDGRGRRHPVDAVDGHQRLRTEPGKDRPKRGRRPLAERDPGGVGRIGVDRDLVLRVGLEGCGRHDLQQLTAPAQLVVERRGQPQMLLDGCGVHERRERERDRRVERNLVRTVGRDRLDERGPAGGDELEGRRQLRHPVAGGVANALVDGEDVLGLELERVGGREPHRAAAPRHRTVDVRLEPDSLLGCLRHHRLAERDLDAGRDQRHPLVRGGRRRETDVDDHRGPRVDRGGHVQHAGKDDPADADHGEAAKEDGPHRSRRSAAVSDDGGAREGSEARRGTSRQCAGRGQRPRRPGRRRSPGRSVGGSGPRRRSCAGSGPSRRAMR